MTACLRTGATLHPSPLELAEKALVAAQVKYHQLAEQWPYGQRTEEQQEAIDNAAVDVADCTAAYLAAKERAK